MVLLFVFALPEAFSRRRALDRRQEGAVSGMHPDRLGPREVERRAEHRLGVIALAVAEAAGRDPRAVGAAQEDAAERPRADPSPTSGSGCRRRAAAARADLHPGRQGVEVDPLRGLAAAAGEHAGRRRAAAAVGRGGDTAKAEVEAAPAAGFAAPLGRRSRRRSARREAGGRLRRADPALGSASGSSLATPRSEASLRAAPGAALEMRLEGGPLAPVRADRARRRRASSRHCLQPSVVIAHLLEHVAQRAQAVVDAALHGSQRHAELGRRPPLRGGRGSRSRRSPGGAPRRSCAAPPRPARRAERRRAVRPTARSPPAATRGREARARPRSMTTLRRIANSQVRSEPISGSKRSPARQARTKASCTASSASPASPSDRSAKRKSSPEWAAYASRTSRSALRAPAGTSLSSQELSRWDSRRRVTERGSWFSARRPACDRAVVGERRSGAGGRRRREAAASRGRLGELADLEDLGPAVGARPLDRRATVLHGHLFGDP